MKSNWKTKFKHGFGQPAFWQYPCCMFALRLGNLNWNACVHRSRVSRGTRYFFCPWLLSGLAFVCRLCVPCICAWLGDVGTHNDIFTPFRFNQFLMFSVVWYFLVQLIPKTPLEWLEISKWTISCNDIVKHPKQEPLYISNENLVRFRVSMMPTGFKVPNLIADGLVWNFFLSIWVSQFFAVLCTIKPLKTFSAFEILFCQGEKSHLKFSMAHLDFRLIANGNFCPNKEMIVHYIFTFYFTLIKFFSILSVSEIFDILLLLQLLQFYHH